MVNKITSPITPLEEVEKINEIIDALNVTHYGTCSTAAGTAAKEVSCSGFKLVTGANIFIKFTVTNTASNPTLNVNGTGAKAVYYNNVAISAGQLKVNRILHFIYNGTQYEFVGEFDTSNNNSLRFSNNIKAKTAITANRLIVGKGDGYNNISSGITFDISYPILRASAAITAGSTGNNNYTFITGVSVRDLIGNSSWTGTQYATVYLVLSALDGVNATVDSTLMTTTVPTSADNKFYIPIGYMYSTYQCLFNPQDKIYAYINGAFREIAHTAVKATQDGSGNTITSYYQPKLTSGTNIKTVNGNSLLGAGNLTVSADTSDCVKKSECSEVQCVVETWHSGANWYRVWSDGWIEQGGNVYLAQDASSTFDLLKPFSDTNATVIACSYHNGTHDTNYMNSVSCYLISATQLKIAHLSAANNYRWYACGY